MRIPYILVMGSGDPADEPQEITTMATYRAACYRDLALTTPEQSLLSSTALVAAATAVMADVGLPEGVTQSEFLAHLHVGEYTDSSVSSIEIDDLNVTADNVGLVRAVVPEEIRDQVEVGDVMSVRLGLQGDYEAAFIWESRAAVVQDGTVTWGDVERDTYVRLDDEDNGAERAVVDMDTGDDVTSEAARIEVTLSRDSIRDQPGCDTDEAVQAVVRDVYDALDTHYPHADTDVYCEHDDTATVSVTMFSGDDYSLVDEVKAIVDRAVEQTIGDGLWDDAA
jgi:hypothetical protein